MFQYLFVIFSTFPFILFSTQGCDSSSHSKLLLCLWWSPWFISKAWRKPSPRSPFKPTRLVHFRDPCCSKWSSPTKLNMGHIGFLQVAGPYVLNWSQRIRPVSGKLDKKILIRRPRSRDLDFVWKKRIPAEFRPFRSVARFLKFREL